MSWDKVRAALESWKGPLLADWQMEAWVKTLGEAGPEKVIGALREIYQDQDDSSRSRPTIREVHRVVFPQHVGPDDATDDGSGPPLTGGARDAMIAKLQAVTVGVCDPEWEDDTQRQLRRQRESIKRSETLRQRLMAAARADGLTSSDASDAVRAEIERRAYTMAGLDYDRSQAAGKPVRLEVAGGVDAG